MQQNCWGDRIQIEWEMHPRLRLQWLLSSKLTD